MRFRDSLSSERGFTLLELLIATAVTMAICGATLMTFQQAMRVNETATLKVETNDSLRTAMDLMVRDFIQVGQGLPAGKTIPLPSGVGATAVVRPSPPNQNYTLPFPATQEVLSAVTPGAALGANVPGTAVATDMVTVVYTDSRFDPVTCNLAADGSSMTVNSPTAIDTNDILLFTNSLGSAVQMVTGRMGLPAQTVTFATGDPLNINQRGAAQGSIMDLRSGAAFPTTTVARLRMVTYFLDTRPDPPQLIRCLNAECVLDPNGRRTVAFGIENLQLSYDLVDSVNNWANVKMNNADMAGGGACGVDPCSPNQIRKVNVFLGARSRQESTLTMRLVRNSLATQVSFRSLALVDRYQ